MICLKKKISLFEKVIGKQTYKNEKYRFINFCVKVNSNDNWLLYNSLTKELLLLSSEEMGNIETTDSNFENKVFKYLIENWFLVPVNFDDFAFNFQLRNLAKQLKNNSAITSFTILTTTGCNARCFYCFEKGVTPIVMTKETAIDVADFIIKRSNGKKVWITWFGGEPLCNMIAIETITNVLKTNNIEFNSEMVSNGYLFTDDIITTAVNEWNIKKVQITLDGTKDNYNKIKNYVYKDTNPFAKVITNIGKLLNMGIKITVRLNMDMHNSYDLYELVDYLNDLYGKYNNFSIYSHLLFENIENNPLIRTDDERNQIVKMYFGLREKIKGYNILSRRGHLIDEVKTNRCMADSPSAIMVLPDGNLGRCDHYLTSRFIGNIYDFTNPQVWNDYVDYVDKCKNCELLPDCFMLKDCNASNGICYDYEKEEKIMWLSEVIMAYYNKYLQNKDDKIYNDI